MASREFERIAWLGELTRRSRPSPGAGRVILGIGDDAALWTAPSGEAAALTVDAQVEGVHFLPGWLTPAEIGARAVATSASDLAAMAARPAGILLGITLPGSAPDRFFRALYRGALAEARRLGLRVLGGNLSAGPLTVTVTSVGAVRPREAVLRHGARPGDGIYVTGWPGRSRVGRALLGSPARSGIARTPAGTVCRRAFAAPAARLREAIYLARRLRPHAMIDVSDGLAQDLRHLLVGAPGRDGRRPLGASILEAPLRRLLGERGCADLARRLGLDPLEAARTTSSSSPLPPPGRSAPRRVYVRPTASR